MNIFEKIKNYFTPKDVESSVSDINKTNQSVIETLLDDKVVVKSLFDNDFIDLDEFRAKIDLINKLIKEEKEKENTNKNAKYADAIIRNTDGDILFLKRSAGESIFPNVWGLPGGKIDDGEDAEAAVKREVVEETNMDVVECFLIGTVNIPDNKTISYFECFVSNIESNIILNSDEHTTYKYISKYDLDKYEFIPGLVDTIKKLEFPAKDKSLNLIKGVKSDISQVPIKINKDDKLNSIEKLVLEGLVNKEFLNNYIFIATTNPLEEDCYKNIVFDTKNQTQLSDKTDEDEKNKRAEHVGLVQFPESVKGAACYNCKFFNAETNICSNKEVDQLVKENMCCNYWDSEGVKKVWELKK